jgi:hypothetical protein
VKALTYAFAAVNEAGVKRLKADAVEGSAPVVSGCTMMPERAAAMGTCEERPAAAASVTHPMHPSANLVPCGACATPSVHAAASRPEHWRCASRARMGRQSSTVPLRLAFSTLMSWHGSQYTFFPMRQMFVATAQQ